MSTVKEVLEKLKAASKSDRLEGMARYGMAVENRLGVAVPDLRRIAKETGKDHRLAIELWETGIAEARIVASMLDIADDVTEGQMEAWVQDFDSWDVCDQVCMNLFEKTPLAWNKVRDWAAREEEFVRRAAFALIACLAWHDKEATDEAFIRFFPIIRKCSTDGRNFVKKAVSWALRNIGKRNAHLNAAAIDTVKEIQKIDSKPARWIASDVIRDLTGETARRRINKKK